jgi:hypothetical protein
MNFKLFYFLSCLQIYSTYNLNGKYIIIYPIKKQVLFNDKNNEIKNNIIELKFHKEDKKFYKFYNDSNNTVILHNVYNTSDYIIMKKLIKENRIK